LGMTRELVGHCGVDSGTILIIDPCYIKHSPEIYDESKWGDFCMKLDNLPKEICQGVVTTTRYGDGNYPVYVTKDSDGNVKKMEIVF
jgi:hypothetical protein